MIERIEFEDFKALKSATLELKPFTLLVGPNGSGKSTVFQAILAAGNPGTQTYQSLAHASIRDGEGRVQVALSCSGNPALRIQIRWVADRPGQSRFEVSPAGVPPRLTDLKRARIYELDAADIARPAPLQPTIELGPRGNALAVVLDRLRDESPERFEALNAELARCMPEFDQILFDTPSTGDRVLVLRTSQDHQRIPANQVSQGTLLALALLTLSYLPEPPPIVCLEEPDRGLHPRLLRDVRDALYRLSYPAELGETRKPVQVIATSHSPVFLDLFRDHPEHIVIAEKNGTEARFHCLSDRTDLDEILQDTPLGDAWYSGILGGVPLNR